MNKNDAFIKKMTLTITGIVIAILLNGVFQKTCAILKLPLFMDSIFTVVIASVFGLVPGIITGLLSNLFFEVINGFSGNFYPFAIVNILTAVISARMASNGFLDRPIGNFWMVLILTLSNSLTGALIVTIFFQGITDQPMDSIVKALILTGQNILSAAFIGRIFINLVDKGIAVLVAIPFYHHFRKYIFNRLINSEKTELL